MKAIIELDCELDGECKDIKGALFVLLGDLIPGVLLSEDYNNSNDFAILIDSFIVEIKE